MKKLPLSIQIGPANWSALQIAGYGSAEKFLEEASTHPDFDFFPEGEARTKALTEAYTKSVEAVKSHEEAEAPKDSTGEGKDQDGGKKKPSKPQTP